MQTREKNPTLQAAYGPQSSSFQPLVSVERFRFSCPSGNTKDDKSSIILAWGKMGKLAFILLLPFLLHQVQNAPMLPPGCSAPPVPTPSSHLILLLIRRLQNHPCCQPASRIPGHPSVLYARQRQTSPGQHPTEQVPGLMLIKLSSTHSWQRQFVNP